MSEKLAPEKRHTFMHNGELPPQSHLPRSASFRAAPTRSDLGFDPHAPAMSRAEGVRVGPDTGGGEHVHWAPQGCAHQALPLHHPGGTRGGWHPWQPVIPQRQCFSSISHWDSVSLDYLLIDVSFSPLNFVACGWGFMPFFWVLLQHDMAHPVKTDSSFWTIGASQFHHLCNLLFSLCGFVKFYGLWI